MSSCRGSTGITEACISLLKMSHELVAQRTWPCLPCFRIFYFDIRAKAWSIASLRIICGNSYHSHSYPINLLEYARIKTVLQFRFKVSRSSHLHPFISISAREINWGFTSWSTPWWTMDLQTYGSIIQTSPNFTALLTPIPLAGKSRHVILHS